MVIETHHQTVVSGITDSLPVNSALLRSTIPTAYQSPIEPEHSQGASSRGGRPKGNANASNRALTDLVREALDKCAIKFVTLKAFTCDKTLHHATRNKSLVPRGAFERVIKLIRRKYNFEGNEMNITAISSRTKPGHKLKVKTGEQTHT
jgi:hypothetical protein